MATHYQVDIYFLDKLLRSQRTTGSLATKLASGGTLSLLAAAHQAIKTAIGKLVEAQQNSYNVVIVEAY
jgi:hypothetical protein